MSTDVTEHKRADEMRRFLAEASSVLASSLDFETTLQALARLSVPMLGDYCFIDVLEDDRQIRRVALAHQDPQKEAILREVQRRYPPPGTRRTRHRKSYAPASQR